ncbi:hydrolase [Nitrosopumilus ureiphilus]|uniref:Hydrolase n=1 Tax=Nitrosopumilus ureiphilus TaxID=1470067 RepID=A0A7D5RAM8_9ARCH|nr:hydrolase [Nitrosopumilus ureiphilus]QLH06604.1 hydrolase [Nitrosopumilus ureiphilus]
MYAVLLLFEKNDKEYLSQIISKLSNQYKSPFFTPHVTVYGLVDTSLEELDKIILDSIKGIKSFNIEKNTISFSDDFWKTLFIEFNSNENMLKINKNLTKYLSQFAKYDLKPHASLIYKEMTTREKQRLADTIEIKNSFKITGVGIQVFSERIEEWKIVREHQLD